MYRRMKYSVVAKKSLHQKWEYFVFLVCSTKHKGIASVWRDRFKTKGQIKPGPLLTSSKSRELVRIFSLVYPKSYSPLDQRDMAVEPRCWWAVSSKLAQHQAAICFLLLSEEYEGERKNRVNQRQVLINSGRLNRKWFLLTCDHTLQSCWLDKGANSACALFDFKYYSLTSLIFFRE